jgi:hypothetical protein
MNINGVEVTENDYVELARWASHLERELNKLIEESKELKSNLLAVIHQRNSLHKKLEEIKQDSTLGNLEVIQTEIVASSDLINPEQYRIAEYKPKKIDIN